MALQNSLKNMVLSLTGICFVCAALLGLAYQLTKETIADVERKAQQAAIQEVLPEYNGELKEAETASGAKYFVAYNGDEVAGYAIKASEYGFSSDVVLMVGFTPSGAINRTKVLSQAETPGLGANCVEPAFAGQFLGLEVSGPLSVTKDGGSVDAITAATITSRAYVKAVNKAIEIYKEISCNE